MKTKSNAFLHAGLLIVLLFAGCAVGRVLSYTEVKTDIPSNPGYYYTVATHDQREEVIDESQKETFVGYMRSTVAIAYPIHTESARRLSDDFSLMIRNSFNEASDRCQVLTTSCKESNAEIFDKLVSTKHDRLLLFTINKWRTDSKPISFSEYATDVIWDIALDVYDGSGEFLVTNRIEGIEPGLDPRPAGSIKRIQIIVNEKLEEKINRLLSDDHIRKALMGE